MFPKPWQVLRPASAGRRTHRRASAGRRGIAALSVLAAVIGVGLISTDGLGRTAPPPMPVATAPPPQAQAHTIGGSATPAPALTSRSSPTRVDIPAIKVAAPLVPLGDASDGTIAVPPANKPYVAGWYTRGVTPGEPGRTVIVGHLDSRYSGPAVFYRLGALRQGQTVTLTRRDRIVVVYRVDGSSIQPKDEFPAAQIYQPSDRSELRLITCGGTYAKQTGWSNNVIVYAHMIGWHRATPAELRRPLRHDTPRR